MLWIKEYADPHEKTHLKTRVVATVCNRTLDRYSRESRPLKKGIQTGGNRYSF